jgi:GH25 family lysozyme M1 (1,4-beta-N-acetylmuramidase)
MTWTFGIDVSVHQGDISWDEVKAGGTQYAFIKATEGVGFEDPQFQRNWLESGRVGIPRGAYHFCLPSAAGVDDAIAEANWFCEVVENKAAGWGELPMVADIETTKIAPIETTHWLMTFCEKVTNRTGRPPIIYAGGAVIPGRMAVDNRLLAYPLWLPHYTAPDQSDPDPATIAIGEPRPPWGEWTIWQYTERGAVPGIAGPVDRNVVEETALAEMIAAPVGPVGPPPEPAKPRTETMQQTVPVLQLGHGWYRPEERPAVTALQALLRARGAVEVDVDGLFGTATDVAVKSWQTKRGLTSDGIADGKTWASLLL